MQIGFYLLIGAIGVSPALVFSNSPLIAGLLAAYSAVAIAIVSFSIRPGEAGYLMRVIRPLFICALLPAAWMLAQTLPVPINDWAHPIWASAQAALGHSLTPSIAIDRGAALVALVSYCFAASVILLSAAATIDRSRADYALLWLAAVTTFSSLLDIALAFDGVRGLIQTAQDFGSLNSLAGLGLLVNAGAADRAVERYETRRSRQEASFEKLIWSLAACVGAFMICAVAIIVVATTPVQFAAAIGLTTLCLVILVRRLALGPWANAVLAVTFVIIAATVITANWGAGDVMLQFASRSTGAIAQVIQSMLADTRWMGNGAGGFGALLPIYQDIDRSVAGPNAPTTAATIAIELGRPALYMLLLMAGLLLIQLLRGALERGRDSFYPTIGAGCVIFLTLEAFCDPALLEKPTIIIASATIGLALAQSVSRTNQTG